MDSFEFILLHWQMNELDKYLNKKKRKFPMMPNSLVLGANESKWNQMNE